MCFICHRCSVHTYVNVHICAHVDTHVAAQNFRTTQQNCDLNAAIQELIIFNDPSSTDKCPPEHSSRSGSAPVLCCGAQLSQAEFLRAFGVSELKKDQAVLVRTAEKKAELLKIFKAKDKGYS